MQKTIRSVDATVRIVAGSDVLLKTPCTKTIWRKEIPITRGYEYDLRDCRRVGLITRCETAAQLRAAESRFGRAPNLDAEKSGVVWIGSAPEGDGISLQGRPPDLDAEKEGATSPDRSSLVAHTRRR
ncbi:unnamed protein product [Sphagnum balticum]